MNEKIPEELDHHDGAKCSYACWSTEPREVMNATAYGVKPRSRWARTSHTVELVANTIIGCSCDGEEFCKHIEHVIRLDTRGCVNYRPIDDRERVHELKEFTRRRRKDLYNRFLAAQ
jgi:hypothetical protein